ncbi:transcription factor MYB44-like [Cannabis sativa]|uniref:transcription factor MYB44-like n=1 Tax=Cannabis sativa TaxID=3483 RepID=UPI0011DF3201|nr:transcription factor MYB44-like [Cannabis sativa]
MSSTKKSASVGAGTVVTGGFLNPGSPSGSDLSDSSLPGMPLTQVFTPLPLSGAIAPLSHHHHHQIDTSSSATDPPTSLSLSLPSSDSSEVSNRGSGSAFGSVPTSARIYLSIPNSGIRARFIAKESQHKKIKKAVQSWKNLIHSKKIMHFRILWIFL